jgi:hypothetical protein
VAPVVDLSELQRVVGKYSEQHNVILAAGPLTAASLLRAFVTKNKLVSSAVVAGGAWFAMRELSGPSLKLMQEQFGYLQGLFSSFRG